MHCTVEPPPTDSGTQAEGVSHHLSSQAHTAISVPATKNAIFVPLGPTIARRDSAPYPGSEADFQATIDVSPSECPRGHLLFEFNADAPCKTFRVCGAKHWRRMGMLGATTGPRAHSSTVQYQGRGHDFASTYPRPFLPLHESSHPTYTPSVTPEGPGMESSVLPMRRAPCEHVSGSQRPWLHLQMFLWEWEETAAFASFLWGRPSAGETSVPPLGVSSQGRGQQQMEGQSTFPFCHASMPGIYKTPAGRLTSLTR